MNGSGTVLSMKDVSWKRNGKMLIDEVSWEINKGEHWALLGLNGSGKTSLLKMITGYQWPNGGQISVLGNLFGRTNLPELRKTIGWVSSSLDQDFQARSHDTAVEAVLSGQFASIGLYEDISPEEVEQAARLLDQFGIRRLANQQLRTLSQGERRKVMLARALMASPQLLILDEPCNGLDIYAKEELLTMIEQLASKEGGPTVIYVTHHIEEIVPSISHALLIKEGAVIAKGEKRETLTEEFLEKTFRVPVTVDWENGRPWIRVKALQTLKENE